MYKLIGIAVAAIPIVLFLRAIFIRRAKQRSQALSDFKKQIDVLVSLILLVIACAVVYAIAKLVYDLLT